MIDFSGQRVLVLAPHTDDGELGCGGTLALLAEQGAEVFYAAFTLAEESVPPPFPQNILETEVKAATLSLGIARERLTIFRYPVRRFTAHRQEILEDLVTLNRNLQPALVFLPCLHDLHQDHATIAAEGVRAFKKTRVLGYELVWNHLQFAGNFFVPLEERHLERKIASLENYVSQQSRSYVSADFLSSLAITRGVQIGRRYAEAFETIRWIW